MNCPHLRQPWTETEQMIVRGIRRGLSYAEIGVMIGEARGTPPLAANTVRHYAARLVGKIEWGAEREGFESLPPRIAVCTYAGIVEALWLGRTR